MQTLTPTDAASEDVAVSDVDGSGDEMDITSDEVMEGDSDAGGSMETIGADVAAAAMPYALCGPEDRDWESLLIEDMVTWTLADMVSDRVDGRRMVRKLVADLRAEHLRDNQFKLKDEWQDKIRVRTASHRRALDPGSGSNVHSRS